MRVPTETSALTATVLASFAATNRDNRGEPILNEGRPGLQNEKS
ncbi:hypothetical protein [Rhodovibrio sodomensis]|nr:hypothetical protein [Rhodovibrio sodomensis]